MMSWIY